MFKSSFYIVDFEEDLFDKIKDDLFCVIQVHGEQIW